MHVMWKSIADTLSLIGDCETEDSTFVCGNGPDDRYT